MRRTASRTLLLAMMAVPALLFAGCGGSHPARPEVTVAAASDLRDILGLMKPGLESASGSRVTFVFGSSGQLKQQIAAGAKYDLFLSADTTYVAELASAGIVTESAGYARGRLALTWRDGLPPLEDIAALTRADVKRIAIANPAHAPYGRAAQQALNSSGIAARIESRLLLAENIRQTLDYVAGGNADAGLVALALVIKSGRPFTVVDASLHEPIVQAGGVVRGGHEAAARAILQRLLSTEGQAALSEYGFEPAAAP